MQPREAKGLALAANVQPHRQDNFYIVPSQTGSKSYTVNLNIDPPTCTCADYAERKRECKHIFAARYSLQRERGEQLPTPPPPQPKPTYKQVWPAYNLAQTNEKAKFQELLYDLTRDVEEMPRKSIAGRKRLPLGDMIFCAAFKTYALFSGRRFISDVREAQQRGYVSHTPHFNSIFNYLELPEMTAHLKQLIVLSALPLKAIEMDFAADSSGFTTGRFVRWFDVKHGGVEDWHDWVKVHMMCGVKTNIVTAVEVSERYANDSPYYKPLLEATARSGFQMKEVSADKGYDSFNNRRLTLIKGAIPYIPFREGEKNKPSASGKGELWKRMYHFYKFNSEEFYRHYHKRSNSESTFSMIKAKFGERIRCQTATGQINEVLCKVLCHSLCCVIQSMYELGIEPTFLSD
jgi:transposase